MKVDWPFFEIGYNNPLRVKFIQGGMGVKISGANLAAAVANEGGAGTIASVGLGFLCGGKGESANKKALMAEIRKARDMSDGVIGVNIMRAATDYHSLIETAVKEKVDFIISGAGLPLDLPKYIENEDVKIIPIVSKVKAAKIIARKWAGYNKVPDAFIVEGPLAGGHLGFSEDELRNGKAQNLEEIARDVINFSKDKGVFEKPVPVIVAGGIYTGADINYFVNTVGASGVQMATRFVTTKECDADRAFKDMYLNAKEKDIQLIKSPVGMPGRAIVNSFLKRISEGKGKKFGCEYKCLHSCNPKESSYCIASALIEAQKGNLNDGFAFAGTNAWRASRESCLDTSGEYISVKTLVNNLEKEYSGIK